jgi:hypothetical protein
MINYNEKRAIIEFDKKSGDENKKSFFNFTFKVYIISNLFY